MLFNALLLISHFSGYHCMFHKFLVLHLDLAEPFPFFQFISNLIQKLVMEPFQSKKNVMLKDGSTLLQSQNMKTFKLFELLKCTTQ